MVNVIIPVYKAKDTIEDALNSLVAQTKKMFIVTFSQDGDGEDYTDIIKEYERRGLHIRHINSEENGGPGIARQRGIDAETMCDYIMFMDSDDMLLPNAIDTLYTEAKRNRVDVLSSNFIAEMDYISNIPMPARSIPITWTHGKIYRLQYLRNNNIRFIPELRYNEDAYFNVVALNCTQNKKTIDETTYLWRHNNKSLTREGGYKAFFDKSWESYIYGQIMGMRKISETLGEIPCNLLGATCIYIFKYYMIAKHYNYDLSKTDSYIKMLNTPILKEGFENIEFWDYVCKNLKGAERFEDVIIFYDMKFSKWIKSYLEE